jgi:hypothetical protein
LAYSDGDEEMHEDEESSPEQSLVNVDDLIDEALLDDFLNPEDEDETPRGTVKDDVSTPSPVRRDRHAARKGGKSINADFSSDEEEAKSPSLLKKFGGLFSFF